MRDRSDETKERRYYALVLILTEEDQSIRALMTIIFYYKTP